MFFGCKLVKISIIFYSIMIFFKSVLFSDTLSAISENKAIQDSAKTPLGIIQAIGIGVSLSETGIISLWEKSLPSSINSFGITPSSFTQRDTIIIDTSLLTFSLKEEPSVHSMTFPLSISLYYLTQNYINKISLEMSWLRKNFSATITRQDTSFKGVFKYYESMDLFKVFIFINGGMRIREEYFSVNGAEKVFFDVGIGISPLVGFLRRKRTEAPVDDYRLNEIKKSINISPLFIHGGAIDLRGGITGLKKIDKNSSAIIEIFLDLCGNGYFLNHGVRVRNKDVYTEAVSKDKPLFWFNTLLGIRFNLLRYKNEKV